MSLNIANTLIDANSPPLVIAEVGINHDGCLEKALQMVDDAQRAGCSCIKFQCHRLEDEMIPNEILPKNAQESIWEIIKKTSLTEKEERSLKQYTEDKGMIYLSTPFSKEAADHLEDMRVCAYKIGSGECNNTPLIEHICRFQKPIILSTGMNDIESISPAVGLFRKYKIPYALLHCTSLYPTPYDKIRLGAMTDLQNAFPDAVIGLSDHSINNYSSFAAVALGAKIIERHFTSSKIWEGPDIAVSMDPKELKDLLAGCQAIYQSLGGEKTILPEEQVTIDFAYACVVTLKEIAEGETFSEDNLWVKRPGTGPIKARQLGNILGKKAKRPLKKNTQISWNDVQETATSQKILAT